MVEVKIWVVVVMVAVVAVRVVRMVLELGLVMVVEWGW